MACPRTVSEGMTTQTPISAEATARREQARDEAGRFGASAAPENDPAQVDLTGAGAAPTVGDHHGREAADLSGVETSLTAQLSAVRTARMQHEIADWLRQTEQTGLLGGEQPVSLALLRHAEEVNEYGSYDLTAGWTVYTDGNPIDAAGPLPDLCIQLHADVSGPDLHADGWVDDEDRVDLDKVRAWSVSSESGDAAFRARHAAGESMRCGSELALAGRISKQVRQHYPQARYVLMEPSGGPTMTLSQVQDVEGNVLHEMYGEAGADVPACFDDDVDEAVRGMTGDTFTAPADSWPALCADGLDFDDYGTVASETRLDLDLVTARTGAQP